MGDAGTPKVTCSRDEVQALFQLAICITPSSLPPPGTLTLSLCLGKHISHGRSGVVLEASVDIQTSSPALATIAIPPLVIKIARVGRNVDLRHEAFYYDEMECIQGVVVPRYYGLFKSDIQPNWSLVSPTEEDKVRDWLHIPPDDSESPSSDSGQADSPGIAGGDADSGGSSLPLTVEDNDTTVYILIMERLGEKLPIGEDLREDVVYVHPASFQL